MRAMSYPAEYDIANIGSRYSMENPVDLRASKGRKCMKLGATVSMYAIISEDGPPLRKA